MISLPSEPDWYQHASCRTSNIPTRVFFPAESAGPTVDRAKQICAACPVRVDCLLHALNEGEEHGIWGGLDETDRRRARRHRPRATA